MRRILLALAALVSYGVARPCLAQQNGGAVEPSAQPQEINEPAQDHAAAIQGHSALTPPAQPPTHSEGMIIQENEKSGAISVSGMPLTIRGHVDGDVNAENSRILIEPKGSVSGIIRMHGGSLENRSTQSIQVQPNASRKSESAVSGIATAPLAETAPILAETRPNWFSQQLALLALGLLCGGVFSVTAPAATRRVSNGIALEPARCLIIGGIATLGLGMVSMLNANLMHHSFNLLNLAWSPFGFGISVVMLGAVAFGWICGLRHFGNYLAQRMGKEAEGTLFGRLATGMLALFVCSLLLGSLIPPLGVFALLLQGLLAIMGLGAAVITGFGREANWLGERLHNGPRFRTR
jgi:hypothetical protein